MTTAAAPLVNAPVSRADRATSEGAAVRAIVQARYGSAAELSLGTVPRPAPARGEVLVEVRAAGLDRGTWHLMTGRPYLMRIMGYGFFAPKNPVPGRDLAGTVVAVGEGVTKLRVGDEVFGIGEGSFAEVARAREDKLAHKPAGLPFEEAAVLGISGLTALHAVRDAGRVRAGQRVLVIGASGGVGAFAVQLAKLEGAEITAVCSGAKADLVRSLGAHRVIDYQREDFTEAAEPYDVILDIGGNTPLARLRRVLSPTGTLVFVGGEDGGDWTAGFGRQLLAAALGVFVKQRFVMLTPREEAAGLVELAKLAEGGALRPALDRVCPLEEVSAAMRDLEAGKVRGKVAVAIGPRP